jgi:cellulose synthase/poly-beta-1,6-N-acetylglucosamine synthase-like glycosyltransferase
MAQQTIRPSVLKHNKRKLALLLPGHNEELIIHHTIRSAVNAGQPLRDIYVVDDNSNDRTYWRAVTWLGEANVLSVERSGKAGAIAKAIKHFNIEEEYEWLHIADADSVFGRHYFRIFRQKLSPKYIAACGFVQTIKSNWISHYRTYLYTFFQSIHRRLQFWLGVISVLPGPTTVLRTDILQDLDFFAGTLTEDFDITIQLHRMHHGKHILFVPEAVTYTQEPRTLSDFYKQISRWHRGFFQVMKRNRIGTRLQRIDFYLAYTLIEFTFYLTQIFIFYPITFIYSRDLEIIERFLISDIMLFGAFTLLTAVLARRFSIILGFPLFFVLRLVEQVVFIKAFVEVIILKKYPASKAHIGWDTSESGRRYGLDVGSLQETVS